MNIPFVMPTCPICGTDAYEISVHGPEDGDAVCVRGKLTRAVRFRCEHKAVSRAAVDFKDEYKPYGSWSAWESVVQCSKATSIALELLKKDPL